MTLTEEKKEVAGEIRRLADLAQDEQRKWTDDDEKAWRKADKRYTELRVEIDEQWGNSTIGRPDASGAPEGMMHHMNSSDKKELIFRDEKTGEEVRSLAPEESFSDWYSQRSGNERLDTTPGHIIQSILTGDPSKLGGVESRAVFGGSDTGGGVVLTPAGSSIFIDLARPAQVINAGSTRLPMSSSEMVIGGLSADPTSFWRGEGVAVTASAPVFKKITLRAKTIACIVPVSIEFLEDAANGAQLIQSAISNEMALRLDQAALAGSGSESEPLGVRNHDSVNTVTGVGTPADYADISTSVRDILNANYSGDVSGLSWIGNPRDFSTYDQLTDSTGQPLQPTPWASSLRRLATTSVATDEGGGSNESFAVVGDFSQMLIGTRTNVNIRVLDSGSVTDTAGDTHNALTELKRHIVVYMRLDVAVLRPSFFTLLSGITI